MSIGIVVVELKEEADGLEDTVNPEHEETDNSVTVMPDASLKPQEENDKKVMTKSQENENSGSIANSKIHEELTTQHKALSFTSEI